MPHPDDEVLAAGGTIHALVEAGVRVRIVTLSAGDGYRRAARRLARRSPDAAAYRALGEVRHAESLAAASTLGVGPQDVVSLGYPDGGLSALLGTHLSPQRPLTGLCGASDVPYAWAYRPGAPACGDSLLADLAAIVSDFEPTAVIGADPRETHADHRAAAAFTARALDDSGTRARRFTFAVHCGARRFPWAYRPDAEMVAPWAAPGQGARWWRVPLSESDRAAKAAAIEDHRSQVAVPDLHRFMRASLRRSELLAEWPVPPA